MAAKIFRLECNFVISPVVKVFRNKIQKGIHCILDYTVPLVKSLAKISQLSFDGHCVCKVYLDEISTKSSTFERLVLPNFLYRQRRYEYLWGSL